MNQIKHLIRMNEMTILTLAWGGGGGGGALQQVND